MNLHTNYYNILFIRNNATDKEIKKAYYKISKEQHPDIGGNESIFKEIVEAYEILSDKELKKEYDNKSKYGKYFSEDDLASLFSEYEYSTNAKNYDKNKYEEFIKRDQLNILIYIDDNFNGIVEYERWVPCKDCSGSGMGSDKIMFKNTDGSISYIDMLDSCEFCEGSGKWGELDCYYCSGKGNINLKTCNTCKGEKRIKGVQRLSGVNFPKDSKDFKIEYMGNYSKDIPGKSGHIWLIKKAIN